MKVLKIDLELLLDIGLEVGIQSFYSAFHKDNLEKITNVHFSHFSSELIHCKYLQPVYSHWLCYVCHCNLAVIVTVNGSTNNIQ